MDLIAFRVLRRNVRLRPGEQLTQNVWRLLAEDKGALSGLAYELESSGCYYGLCWMINPHEINRIRNAYDPLTDLGIGNTVVPIWVYAVMPRTFAMLRRLKGSRNKTGIKAYPPEKFLGRQKFVDISG